MTSTERILVLAPLGRDGKLIVDYLSNEGVEAYESRDTAHLCEMICQGAGAIVVTEEALVGTNSDRVREVLAGQPAWSDLPLVLLTSGDEEGSKYTKTLVRRLSAELNVTILERPLHAITLISAVQAALRSRRRQYEVRSLTEELERKVAQRTEDLVEKNQQLEGFTYSVSHDLRTPLRAIVSNAAIVMEDEGDSLSESGRASLKRLSNAALKMAQLVDDLLQYARLAERELRLEEVDMGELIEEAANLVRAESPDCDLRLQVHGPMPAKCDPRIMGMALVNIIGNSCKYRKPGPIACVTAGTCMLGNERVFYIQDEGIGFDMKYLSKLFIPFERLHREEFSGTGIGLANVRRAVERHGGRIWATGELGKGSTFYFTLG
jgi:signal transduction histidine kinase